MKQQLLIVGCGYFGGHLANRLDRDTYEISATTRSKQRFDELRSMGISPIQLDVTHSITGLEKAFDQVVYCVGFDRKAGQSREKVYVDGLSRFLGSTRQPRQNFVFVSSTGVYGQSSGEWVDEDSPTIPDRDAGKVLLDAENLVRDSAWDCRKWILRFAGIYGLGRVPNLQKIISPDGGKMEVPPNSYLNLIHVEDAAGIVAELLNPFDHSPIRSCETLIVADGAPVQRREFYQGVAAAAGVDAPGFAEADHSAPPSGRASTNKRVSNRKLKRLIPYKFHYPDYRAGLADIFNDSNGPLFGS